MTKDDVRQRFYELGCEWYSLSGTKGSHDRQEELEAEAVALLRDNAAVIPGISALKRDGANVAFFPPRWTDCGGVPFLPGRVAAAPPDCDLSRGRRHSWCLEHGRGRCFRTSPLHYRPRAGRGDDASRHP